MNNLIRFLVESGEDKALGILMCVCGLNNVLLDPHVLAGALKVVEPVIDFVFPFRLQGSDAVEPLLAAVQAEDISWERQAFGATIAAELACAEHDSHQQVVKRTLLKLSQKIHAVEANGFIIDQSLALLDGEGDGNGLHFTLGNQTGSAQSPCRRKNHRWLSAVISPSEDRFPKSAAMPLVLAAAARNIKNAVTKKTSSFYAIHPPMKASP